VVHRNQYHRTPNPVPPVAPRTPISFFFSDGTVRYGFSAATNEEPYNLQAALSDQNWKAAMESEISALVRNKTWTLILVPPAPDGNLFDCKWVY
jgi:hypothetical protein